MGKAIKDYNNLVIKNKRASFEYSFLEHFTAGIVLTGTEIKSIRNSQASINEAYCTLINKELFIRNMHIAEFKEGSYNNHITKRDRKLLLNKRELLKIAAMMKDKGLTIIPVRLFITDKGLAKIDIAVAKGKKMYDKREDIKKRDTQRELDRIIRK